MPRPVCIDFETESIERRPEYPPRPIGVSIMYWGRKPSYYAFAHYHDNNCVKGAAKKALKDAYRNDDGVLFHNAKFDLDVAEVHFGIKIPKWQRVHDTMLLLYLDDPHALQLGLKPSAERLLGMSPEERNVVGEWMLEHQPVEGVKVTDKESGKYTFMKYLKHAPGRLVGQYANGDVVRTLELYKLLYPRIVAAGMLEAYDRERQLLPILLDMERRGLQMDHARLRSDCDMYHDAADKVDKWLHSKLGEDVNLSAGQQLMKALIARGYVDEGQVPRTKNGGLSSTKDVLVDSVNDPQILAMLNYRGRLAKSLSTFMLPWLEMAESSNGLAFTTWHQVRGPTGLGTRTGRLSSTPNFQNIPNVFEPIFSRDKRGLPTCPVRKLPRLPQVRSYVTAYPGDAMINRDFSQQELRILAYLEDGAMLNAYATDPWMDFHTKTQQALAEAGMVYERKDVKITNFGIVYGMGVGKLADATGLDAENARQLRNNVLHLYQGLERINTALKTRAMQHEPVHTWGGRVIYCEEPKVINGRVMTFDYKMLNHLVQGSAADCTKAAIIRWDEMRQPDWRLILNVHDELSASVPQHDVHDAMQCMREAMDGLDFDEVPMLSEGKVSYTNWADLTTYDKQGVRV